jgi:hypothetical protein
MQGDFVRARLRVTTHWSAVPTLLAPHVKALPTSSIFLGKISSSAEVAELMLQVQHFFLLLGDVCTFQRVM